MRPIGGCTQVAQQVEVGHIRSVSLRRSASLRRQVGGANDGQACHLMFCHEGWHRYRFFCASLSMLECVTEQDERHPQEGGLAPLNLVPFCQQK